MNRIATLRNAIQEYEWGSRTAIASLLGAPVPSDRPQAELWMGAHARAPSQVVIDRGSQSLVDVIRRDPVGVLGAAVAERFGGELPFLLKVLAAERPLSMQAHPDARQAAAGFARENARGIALDASERCYRDPHAKPELLCALTPFRALVGFREIPRALARLSRLAAPSLAAEVSAFRADPTPGGLRRFFGALLTLPVARRERAVAEAAHGSRALAAEDRCFATLLELCERHPGDAGALAPLLLNPVELEPSQAIFLRAGEPHTYLHGVGIEIMASSDNVLRGGLTAKHVDVPELLRVLRFEGGPPHRVLPEALGPTESVYEAPAEEFALSVLRPGAAASFESATQRSVEILLCIEGSATLQGEGDAGRLALERGTAVLVPAAVRRYRIWGSATVYKACVPVGRGLEPRAGGAGP